MAETEEAVQLVEEKQAAEEELIGPAGGGDADEASEPSEADGLEGAEEAKEKAKDKGNEEYAKGNFEAAVKAWTRSLQSVKYILDKNFYEHNQEQLQEVFAMDLRLCLNLAQGYLKLGQWSKAVEMADKALEREPRHPKALYRKASALMQLLSFREAEGVVEALLQVDPSNAEGRRMLAEVRRSAEKGQKRERKMAEKMFASPGVERDPRTPPTQLESFFDFVASVPSEVIATVYGFRERMRETWRSYCSSCQAELRRRWLLFAGHARKRLEGMGLLRHKKGTSSRASSSGKID